MLKGMLLLISYLTLTISKVIIRKKGHSMQEVLFTVKQVSELLHTNPAYVYRLINNKLLPVLKLGSFKVRKSALDDFLEKYEGYDLTDPENVKLLSVDSTLTNAKIG